MFITGLHFTWWLTAAGEILTDENRTFNLKQEEDLCSVPSDRKTTFLL